MLTKIKTRVLEFVAALSVQRYVDAPVAGRLAPQPNADLAMTGLVKRLLQVK